MRSHCRTFKDGSNPTYIETQLCKVYIQMGENIYDISCIDESEMRKFYIKISLKPTNFFLCA